MGRNNPFIILALAVVTPALALAVTFSGDIQFGGNLAISGTLSKGSGTFVIDHPQKPRTHLLYHSFIESPDVKNIYDGITTLDAQGEAFVKLPSYFEALNKDFRYQFFPLDEPMPDLHIKNEVADNQFTIAGGIPGGKISWQITGIRHDPYILANPIIPEVEKGPGEIVGQGECIFEPLCE
ncbi:hypothetical protein COU18_02450 [Candidatus Kaiserbacteria bacterium CG10_big_fil_rev_8_21_14_0_10_51_14]|uniref:Uncharacterized protein n=1 Tax=Candidatus Kaiserbacteria bacterium CG10_big_fil_rev_8_21_14_0_10_51_14 TaxID=1974610 RepID=A0A2H0UBL9_9BACT|nr:MAG: hypothetical protein COU18_02450 [Candidatus Kaiserbacteria bacterium CG10_big_fil_rev_8_21_14_0_10_51_14]